MARHGKVIRAWQGSARQGVDGYGMARHGKVILAPRGKAGCGSAMRG